MAENISNLFEFPPKVHRTRLEGSCWPVWKDIFIILSSSLLRPHSSIQVLGLLPWIFSDHLEATIWKERIHSWGSTGPLILAGTWQQVPILISDLYYVDYENVENFSLEKNFCSCVFYLLHLNIPIKYVYKAYGHRIKSLLKNVSNTLLIKY